MKRKTGKEIPPLCAAVKRVREEYGDTQERFARRLGVAVMTVSKYETGRAEPRDSDTLLSLCVLASDKGLTDEKHLFHNAYEEFARARNPDFDRNVAQRIGSLREWRLSFAARLAILYFPEIATALERAAGPALAIIDNVLADAPEDSAGGPYERFEREAFLLAEREVLKDFQKRKDSGQ